MAFPFADFPLEIVEHEISTHLDEPSLFALSLVDKKVHPMLKPSPYFYSYELLRYYAGKGNNKSFLEWIFDYFGYWEEPRLPFLSVLVTALMWQNVEIALWVIGKLDPSQYWVVNSLSIHASQRYVLSQTFFPGIKAILDRGRLGTKIPSDPSALGTYVPQRFGPALEAELREYINEWFRSQSPEALNAKWPKFQAFDRYQTFLNVLAVAVEVGDSETAKALCETLLAGEAIEESFRLLLSTRDPKLREVAFEILKFATLHREYILTAVRSGCSLDQVNFLANQIDSVAHIRTPREWFFAALSSNSLELSRHFFNEWKKLPSFALASRSMMEMIITTSPEIFREFLGDIRAANLDRDLLNWLGNYALFKAEGKVAKEFAEVFSIDLLSVANPESVPINDIRPDRLDLIVEIVRPDSPFLMVIIDRLSRQGDVRLLAKLSARIPQQLRLSESVWYTACLGGKVAAMSYAERFISKPTRYRRRFFELLQKTLISGSLVVASMVVGHLKEMQPGRFARCSKKFVAHFASVAQPYHMDWFLSRGFEITSSCYLAIMKYGKGLITGPSRRYGRLYASFPNDSHWAVFQWLALHEVPLPSDRTQRSELLTWLKTHKAYENLAKETRDFFEGVTA